MTRRGHRLLAAVRTAAVHLFRRLGPWLVYGLALAAGALLFFAWLADEVLEGSTRAFDEDVRSFVNSHASPTLTSVMRFVTMLGSTTWLVVLGLCVAAGLLILGRRREVLLFIVTMAGATALNLILKASFARDRPAAFFDTPLPSSYSFPSGHALLSLCFYGAVAASITPGLKRRPIARAIVWTAAALLVALIGFSRVYLGVHYPSDVIAGYAAALVWVVVLMSGNYLQRRP